MTTLPQTTGTRLARPSATPMDTGGHHTPPTPGGMTGADVWRVLRANSWIIIGLLIFAGLAGYGVNYLLLQYNAKYLSYGYVQITPTKVSSLVGPDEGSGLDPSMLNIDLKSQAQLLKTDTLFSKVLQESQDLRDTAWFKKFIKPTKQSDGTVVPTPDVAAAKDSLNEIFAATPVTETKYVYVSATTTDPQSAKVIVETVVNTHLNGQQDLARDRITTRSQNINQAKNKLLLKIGSLNSSIRAAQIELEAAGISPGGYRGIASPKEMQLSEQIRYASQTARDLTEYKTSLTQFENDLKDGQTPATVTTMLNTDPTILRQQQSVSEADLQYESFKDQLGEKHQLVKRFQAQVTSARHSLEDATAAKRLEYTETVRSEYANKVAQYDASLKAQMDALENEQGKMGELSYKAVQYLVQLDEMRALQDQVKLLDKQIDAIVAAANQETAGVAWATQPLRPDSPSSPKLSVTLPVAMVLGLLVGLGIAFSREFMDQTVRSPRDLARVGQLNLLGMIPHEDDDSQSAGIALPLAIAQAPTGIIAENYRQVRTRLQHMASLDTTRSLLVTSPGPDDGKTTVACNLAAGLALNGRRILLVDANFRKPTLHKVFNINNDTGFSSVLAAPESYSSFVQPSSVPNLDVLPIGPKPTNPTELLESSLLTDFVDRALADYDHVIFDSGPLLLVSETVALAPRVDGVVTVIRASTNSRGLLVRLRDALRQLKAQHIGVVLNAVKAQGGGYYGRSIRDYYAYQNGQH